MKNISPETKNHLKRSMATLLALGAFAAGKAGMDAKHETDTNNDREQAVVQVTNDARDISRQVLDAFNRGDLKEDQLSKYKSCVVRDGGECSIIVYSANGVARWSVVYSQSNRLAKFTMDETLRDSSIGGQVRKGINVAFTVAGEDAPKIGETITLDNFKVYASKSTPVSIIALSANEDLSVVGKEMAKLQDGVVTYNNTQNETISPGDGDYGAQGRRLHNYLHLVARQTDEYATGSSKK